MKKKKAEQDYTLSEIEAELYRVKFRDKYLKLLKSTVYALIVTAAVAAITATLFLPVLEIYGTSMTPTLKEGDIAMSVKTDNIDRGDIISFYLSNKILVKRVIGLPFDTVDMDEQGNFYINGKLLDEDYIDEKAYGVCDIKFPYQVPEDSYFVVGDHRATSVDSRSRSVGCVQKNEIVGKIIFTVWPLKDFGVTK